ncbi:hypothetical protein UPYG_G00275410 [Umbra pygmaea]|uniref:Pro-neuregulin-1, membrane-bound isoform n=1 Tax=Umbra pygmaea TaxID=75934 RepID=A0ABD0W257_UMBPY
MTKVLEGEESPSGPILPSGPASPTRNTEEAEAGGGGVDEGVDKGTQGGDDGDGGRAIPLGLLALTGTCCVCVPGEQVRGCLRSEKICILPILACLLSLALCTAGLKWVFVDKIFEYEPPTHLDPNRQYKQNPSVIVADPTKDLPIPRVAATGRPTLPVGGTAGGGAFARVTQYVPTSAVTYSPTQPGHPATPKTGSKETPTPNPKTTVESNDIVPMISASPSTTPAVKTSSHVTRCSESKKNYCVNGGECFTLEVTPGEPKLLCRCLTGYTGKRCESTIPVRVISQKQAEELYQKRVLTITGICIALLVVGIMCVVAYCKTKKQRKKLHDRLRQSLRNERNTMAGMANGAQMTNSPVENVQLVNQFVCKDAFPAQHVMEKETETSFSMSQYTSSAQQSTTVTHTSSQSWSNGRSESALSDSRHVLIMSSGENSRHATPSHRGRLNATGGARDLSAYLKDSRDTPDSCRECLYDDRYVSAMTTPVTPGSPPSETSAPLSSLATPGPSQAVSPSGEEEHLLLFMSSPWSHHPPNHSQSKRNSAHYNHGNDAHTPPPSPMRTVEDDDDYETTQEYEAVATVAVSPATLQDLPKKLTNGGRRTKRTQVNGHAAGHKRESRGDSTERSSSESETEEDRVGEDTPFLTLQNPLDAGVEPLKDSSRTNPALRLSPQDDLQARLSSIIANQDPIAV